MQAASRFTAMGCDILVPPAAEKDIRHLFARYEQTFSRFVEASELNAVNARSGAPVVVSPLFADAVRLALQAATETGGAVDPTLGAQLEAAGYDRDFAAIESIDEVPAEIGPGCWQAVRLDGRVLSVPASVKLDLNGVVKGMAVDAAVQLLSEGSISGWVSAGGDLATTEPVDVALPADGEVRLVSGGLATSSTRRRRWWRGGWQHHLLDPDTGRPSSTCWTDVTVCAASCVAADVAAKATLLKGEAGPAWLEAHGLTGRLVTADGEIVTVGWPEAALCI